MKAFGQFRLDTTRKVLWRDSVSVQIPPKELEILCLLVEHAGELVTKNEIIDRVWADLFVEESNLTRRIYLLRNLLKKYGADDDLIENVPTRGYRFTGSVDCDPAINGSIRIERHLLTETLIEELENTDDQTRIVPTRPSAPWLRVSKLLLNWRLQLIAVFAVVVFLTAGFAYMSFARSRLAGGARIRSVAVLPFRTVGGSDGDRAGFGLADILITRLSNIRELNIRPTSAVFVYSQQDAAEFGRGLDVDAVLEGTVYHTGDNVRVTVQLVRVSDRTTIWAGQFEQPFKDEFKLQDELALQVVGALAINITGDEKSALTRRYTENADAYQTYLKGRYSWNKRSNESLSEAERQFRNAIEKDPKFALAYVGLADTTGMRSDATEAYSAVRRALEIDPNLAEAHATLGFLQTFHEWNWRDAEASFKRSNQLNPGYATAHQWYASLLAVEGRFDEAKAEMRRALEINPVSHNFLADLGQIHYFAREYDQAEDYCLRALKVYPDFGFAHTYLQQIYLKQGRYSEAVEENIRTTMIQFQFSNYGEGVDDRAQRWNDIGREAYKRDGLAGFANWRLREGWVDASSDVGSAMNRILLGQKEAALDNLEKATRNRAFMMTFAKADPIYDDLRGEPRFQAILKTMDLSDQVE